MKWKLGLNDRALPLHTEGSGLNPQHLREKAPGGIQVKDTCYSTAVRNPREEMHYLLALCVCVFGWG